MRASIAFLVAAAIIVCFKQENKATPTNNVVSLHTDFTADARLDATELSNVVKLASMCGIEQVAEVRTFHYFPTSSRGIEVTSADQMSGRNITYKTSEIFREGWAYKSKQTGSMQAISVGPFWVEGLGIPTTHTAKLFNTVNGFIHVEVETGISTNVADMIINAFTSTNFLVRESQGIGSVDKSLIEGENLSRPDRLVKARTAGHYGISFSGGGSIYECGFSSNKTSVFSVTLPPTP